MRRGVHGALGALGALLIGSGAAAGDLPRAVLLPPLDQTGRLADGALAALEERLIAALEGEQVVRIERLSGGPFAERSWAAHARRFQALQAEGITYAVQLFWRPRARGCELSLLAVYLPSWDRGRYAHSIQKSLACDTALEPALDELVKRGGPALAAPPERALARLDGGPPVVAVFLMESKGTAVGADDLASLTGRLTASLAESGQVRVLTREEIRTRILDLSPRKGRDKECFERECFLRLSREVEADYAVFSTLSKVGSICLLQVQGFDADRAISVAGVTDRGECQPASLAGMVARAAPRLERALLGSLP